MDGLHALRNGKAALDAGLITQADYDALKATFLTAQQLRAGIDAGLIKEEDVAATKSSYLSSIGNLNLSMNLPSQPSRGEERVPIAVGNGSSAVPATTKTVVEAKPQPQQQPPAPPPPPPPGSTASQAPAACANVADRPPVPAQSVALVAHPLRSSSSQADLPSNIPRVGGAKLPSGVSMSGISVTEDSVNLYYLIRAKSTYKWATWRVDEAGTSVIIAAVGEPSSTYADFIAALPENDCRYGGKCFYVLHRHS